MRHQVRRVSHSVDHLRVEVVELPDFSSFVDMEHESRQLLDAGEVHVPRTALADDGKTGDCPVVVLAAARDLVVGREGAALIFLMGATSVLVV